MPDDVNTCSLHQASPLPAYAILHHSSASPILPVRAKIFLEKLIPLFTVNRLGVSLFGSPDFYRIKPRLKRIPARRSIWPS